ncbi:MAG TPA: PQQ-binding-like beta-propeller repeat protein [Gammaproteobacteria bacterium]
MLSDEAEDCLAVLSPPDPVTVTRGPAERWIVGTTDGHLVAIDDVGNCEEIYDDPDEYGYAINNLLLDAANDTLYFTARGAVFSSSASGMNVTEMFSSYYTNLLAFDPNGDRLLLQDPTGIVAYNLDSRVTKNIANDEEVRVGSGPRITDMYDAAFDFEKGVAYVINRHGELFTVDLQSGARASFLDEPVALNGGHLIFDEQGNRIITDAASSLITVDIDTGEKTVLARPVNLSFDMPGTMPFDAAGNRLIHASGNVLYAFSLDTYTNSIISVQGSEDYLGAADLDMRRNRAIVVRDFPPELIAIDLVTGDTTTLTEFNASASPAVKSVADVNVDAVNDDVWLIDQFNGNFVRVDLATGKHEIVAGDAIANGISFADPVSLGIDEEDRIAWILDAATGSLVAVDLASGDRVIISR